jgi:hypothetical protein
MARMVMDCAGNVVEIELLVLPLEGAVTATFGFETIAFMSAAL